MPTYRFAPNPYADAMRNFPALQRAAMERVKEDEKEREFEEKRGDTENYRDRRLQLEERKEGALEAYRSKALDLAEKSKDLTELRIRTEMGKAEFDMEKEMQQARETMQQQSEMTKAIRELGKVNVKSPDYLDSIADIRSRYPNAFKQSKNGEETFVHGFVDSIYKEHAEYMKGIDQAREKYGPNLAINEKTGDIDWKATQGNLDAQRAKDFADTKTMGLQPTGMTETEHGPSYRFGTGADGITTTTQTQSTTPTGETKIVTTKEKGAPAARAVAPVAGAAVGIPANLTTPPSQGVTTTLRPMEDSIKASAAGAIQRGANRDAVMERLRKGGYDPTGL